jgi:hypothetical protein
MDKVMPQTCRAALVGQEVAGVGLVMLVEQVILRLLLRHKVMPVAQAPPRELLQITEVVAEVVPAA